jgi:hypothetical protein
MAKLDRIKQDNPELNITIIDVIQSIDPSSTNKYCEFLIKMIKGKDNTQRAIVDSLISGLFGVKAIESLHKFEEHSKANRIPQEFKDISRHNDWFFIEEGVKIADEVVKRKQLEKETKKLFENDEWVVLIPESYEASQLYAYNTKWCITQKNYWNDYKKSSRIIFVINKKNNEKYAISKRMNDSVIQGWDAKDKETSPLIWEFTDEIWKILRSELKKTKLDLDLEQLPEGTIYGSRGKVVPLNDASIRELESFYKSYSEVISSEFKEMIISRGKSLRDQENENKKTTPDIVKVSKLINDLSYKNIYYDSAKYDMGSMDLSDLLKTLNL